MKLTLKIKKNQQNIENNKIFDDNLYKHGFYFNGNIMNNMLYMP